MVVVNTHLWYQVDRAGEMEPEVNKGERTHHFETTIDDGAGLI